MSQFAALAYYKDEDLTKRLDQPLDFGRNVRLDEKRTLTFYVYNIGNAKLQRIHIKTPDPNLVVKEVPEELSPQEKAKVVLEYVVVEPRDLDGTLDITGVYEV